MSDTAIPSLSSRDLPLKTKLRNAERRNKIRAYCLILPLGIFILVFFIAPIVNILVYSVDNPLLVDHFPKTVDSLKQWDPTVDELPTESVYAAFAEEMHKSAKEKTIGRIATRLNYDHGGIRSLMTKTARKLKGINVTKPPPRGTWKKTLLKIDKRWGKKKFWAAIKNTSNPITAGYYLAAVDKKYDINGSIIEAPEFKQIYLMIFWRTVWISALVTIVCILLAYPVAFLLANLPLRYSNLLMILVLLPFWTSLLVRTTSWVVVLQTQGVLNDLMLFLGLIEERIQLIFNRFGVIVAMTHILLPFMILPIYSVMKNISPTYVRAARSLGANQWTAFWRIYFPQSVPGIGAGGLLVFILALGYYITPALVGGPKDQMISYFIALHTNQSLNWGLASALGTILLFGVLVAYWVYDKLVGIDNMKLG
jgi:putative spermidine/putrescine transport system permease protein